MFVSDQKKLEKFLDVATRNPRTAVAEGFRRNAKMFDDLDFIYTSVSSGKDSLFMSQIAILELQRRQDIARKLAAGEKIDTVASELRSCGLATQYTDNVESFKKWTYAISAEETAKRNKKFINREIVKKEISELDEAFGIMDTSDLKREFLWSLENAEKHPELAGNHRLGMLVMEYELSFDQSDEVLRRIAKEFATDIKLIEPDGVIDLEKSVKENGYDLRWVSDNQNENPHRLTREQIENLKPYELADVYGKALVFLFDMCQSIAWENNSGTDNSRYISFEPDKKSIWVKHPPVSQDPHGEWVITNENLYESHYGLTPMVEILPAMSDQVLRVEFSKYITRAVTEALQFGWPAKKWNEKTGKYE